MSRKYKHDYVEVIKRLVPSLYEDMDFSVYGKMENDSVYKVAGSLVQYVSKHIQEDFNPGNFDSSSWSQYFIPSNKLTKVTPDLFQECVLTPFGRSYSDFSTSAEFVTFIQTSALPGMRCTELSTSYVDKMKDLHPTLSSAAEVQKFLQRSLGLFYLLNKENSTLNSNPTDVSGLPTKAAVTVFLNEEITEGDMVKVLMGHLWTHRESSTSVTREHFSELSDYVVGDAGLSGAYTSGTQLLDSLLTHVSILYASTDESSDFLQTSFDLYETLNQVPTREEVAAPFTKYLRALAYAFYDVDVVFDELQHLLDIERCPPEFLEYLATYLGWTLQTGDIESWRSQLRQAVHVYKSKGTRRALDTALVSVFPSSIFTPTSALEETWESYLPNLIHYTLVSESPYLKRGVFTKETANALKLNYSNVDRDLNLKYATDRVVEYLHNETSCIRINNKRFSSEEVGTFHHRGKELSVPPWENERFYDDTLITPAVLINLQKVLTDTSGAGGFGVPTSAVDGLVTFVSSLTLDSSAYHGTNVKWKFHTSSQELPFNFSAITAGGDFDALSLLDYWSAKSSTVFTLFTRDQIDMKLGSVVEGAGSTKAVDIFSDIVSELAPFHVVSKVLVPGDVASETSGTIDGYEIKNEPRWVGVGKIDAITTGDEFLHNPITTSYEGQPGVYLGGAAHFKRSAVEKSARPSSANKHEGSASWLQVSAASPISQAYGASAANTPIKGGSISLWAYHGCSSFELSDDTITNAESLNYEQSGIPTLFYRGFGDALYPRVNLPYNTSSLTRIREIKNQLRLFGSGPKFAETGGDAVTMTQYTSVSSLKYPIQGESSITPNKWHHFVFTYNGDIFSNTGKLGVFIDGVRQQGHSASATGSSAKGTYISNDSPDREYGTSAYAAGTYPPMFGTDENMWHGYQNDNDSDDFDPRLHNTHMSHISMYSGVLNDGDVRGMYNAGSPPDLLNEKIYDSSAGDSLVAWWPCHKLIQKSSKAYYDDYAKVFDSSSMRLVWSGLEYNPHNHVSSLGASSFPVAGHKPFYNVERSTGRRRNFRYAMGPLSYTRNGLSQPSPHVASGFVSASSFLPTFKGYNASAGKFVTTTGVVSSVWDASNSITRGDGNSFNDVTQSFLGVKVMDTYPVRSYSEEEVSGALGGPIRRELNLDKIADVIIRETIRRGEKNRSKIVFGDDITIGFNFGTDVYRLFHTMQEDFLKRVSRNLVTQIEYVRFLGGFNLVSHAYGPLVENHNFSYPGVINYNGSALAFTNRAELYVSSLPEWATVAAPHTVSGFSYVNEHGTHVQFQHEGQFQQGAWGVFQAPGDVLDGTQTRNYTSRYLLSGIDVVVPEASPQYIAVNQPGSNNNLGTLTGSGSITFGGGPSVDPVQEAAKLRFNLTRNTGGLANHQFKAKPIASTSLLKPQTSSIANWNTEYQSVGAIASSNLIFNGNFEIESGDSTHSHDGWYYQWSHTHEAAGVPESAAKTDTYVGPCVHLKMAQGEWWRTMIKGDKLRAGHWYKVDVNTTYSGEVSNPPCVCLRYRNDNSTISDYISAYRAPNFDASSVSHKGDLFNGYNTWYFYIPFDSDFQTGYNYRGWELFYYESTTTPEYNSNGSRYYRTHKLTNVTMIEVGEATVTRPHYKGKDVVKFHTGASNSSTIKEGVGGILYENYNNAGHYTIQTTHTNRVGRLSTNDGDGLLKNPLVGVEPGNWYDFSMTVACPSYNSRGLQYFLQNQTEGKYFHASSNDWKSESVGNDMYLPSKYTTGEFYTITSSVFVDSQFNIDDNYSLSISPNEPIQRWSPIGFNLMKTQSSDFTDALITSSIGDFIGGERRFGNWLESDSGYISPSAVSCWFKTATNMPIPGHDDGQHQYIYTFNRNGTEGFGQSMIVHNSGYLQWAFRSLLTTDDYTHDASWIFKPDMERQHLTPSGSDPTKAPGSVPLKPGNPLGASSVSGSTYGWTHVLTVVPSGTWESPGPPKIWINGERAQAYLGGNQALPSYGSTNRIGSNATYDAAWPNASSFCGWIDDVSVFSSLDFDDEDAKALYAGADPSILKPDDIVSWWTLGDGDYSFSAATNASADNYGTGGTPVNGFSAMDQVGNRTMSGVRFNSSSNILPFCSSANPVSDVWGAPSGTCEAMCPPPLASSNYVDHYVDSLSFERSLANSLMPDTNYTMTLKALTNNPDEGETLGVRVITERLPLAGDGVETRRYVYNWNTQRWERYNASTKTNYANVKIIGSEWDSYTLRFHTDNLQSDYSLTDSFFADWGELHSKDTGYFIEVFRSTPNAKTTHSITLDEVSIVDVDMNKLVHQYNPEDLETIFDYLQTLGNSKTSRSSEFYGKSGGSRATVSEPMGGVLGTVNYNYYNERLADASGVAASGASNSTQINITD